MQCSLSPKRYADTVRKVIQSAVANATNNHDLDRDKLVVAEAVVGKGTFIKRVSIHGRGRAGTITKPRTHVRVELAERENPEGRRTRVREHEAPWKRRRRVALEKFTLAREAGLSVGQRDAAASRRRTWRRTNERGDVEARARAREL